MAAALAKRERGERVLKILTLPVQALEEQVRALEAAALEQGRVLEASEARLVELVAKYAHERSAQAESTAPGEPALVELNTFERDHGDRTRVTVSTTGTVHGCDAATAAPVEVGAGFAVVHGSTVPSLVPTSMDGIGVGSGTLGTMTMLGGVI